MKYRKNTHMAVGQHAKFSKAHLDWVASPDSKKWPKLEHNTVAKAKKARFRIEAVYPNSYNVTNLDTGNYTSLGDFQLVAADSRTRKFPGTGYKGKTPNPRRQKKDKQAWMRKNTHLTVGQRVKLSDHALNKPVLRDRGELQTHKRWRGTVRKVYPGSYETITLTEDRYASAGTRFVFQDDELVAADSRTRKFPGTGYKGKTPRRKNPPYSNEKTRHWKGVEYVTFYNEDTGSAFAWTAWALGFGNLAAGRSEAEVVEGARDIISAGKKVYSGGIRGGTNTLYISADHQAAYKRSLPKRKNGRKSKLTYAQWEAQLKRELKSMRYPHSWTDFKGELRSPTQTGDEALREGWRAGEDPVWWLQAHGDEMRSSLRYNPRRRKNPTHPFKMSAKQLCAVGNKACKAELKRRGRDPKTGKRK